MWYSSRAMAHFSLTQTTQALPVYAGNAYYFENLPLTNSVSGPITLHVQAGEEYVLLPGDKIGLRIPNGVTHVECDASPIAVLSVTPVNPLPATSAMPTTDLLAGFHAGVGGLTYQSSGLPAYEPGDPVAIMQSVNAPESIYWNTPLLGGRPTLVPFGSKMGLQFDEVDDALRGESTGLADIARNRACLSILMVAAIGVTTAARTILTISNNAGLTRLAWVINSGGGSMYGAARVADGDTVQNGSNNTITQNLAVYGLRMNFATETLTQFENGEVVSNDVLSTLTAGNSSNTASTQVRFGTQSNSTVGLLYFYNAEWSNETFATNSALALSEFS